ncbi:MAG: UDP-N-acetylmuramoyl-L-alanyl-D-glutamate--2,6-diaminopimelate ligase [Oligoflexales bacterium]
MTYFEKDLILNLKLAYEHLKQQDCVNAQGLFPWESGLQGKGRIISDSRQIKAGDIFIAYEGLRTDSHEYIPEVLNKKPGLIIAEKPSSLEEESQKAPILLVNNSRKAWSYLCALACGNPQNELTNIAITGTNGKTSSLWMLKSLFESHNIPYATIGTLGIYLNGDQFRTSHTTPDPPILYLSLKLALEKGVKILAMEASSHAIAQEKLAPIRFNCIAWTSFSQDHLDFHKTMDAYWKVKWSLFLKSLAPGGRAIINTSISPIPPYEKLACQDIVTYGLGKSTLKPLMAVSQIATGNGGSDVYLSYKGSEFHYQIPYWGSHNVENFLCALGVYEKAVGKMPSPRKTIDLSGVPGRLQKVPSKKLNAPCVLIDYAHTPDALEKTIETIKPYCSGMVYVVFGCGGERDRNKRKKMGLIAETLADKVVLTSDNPRNEPAEKILKDIQRGFLKSQPVMIEDRKSAIAWSIEYAKKDDFILVAGKGHENYQIIGSKVFEFDDFQVAKAILDSEEEENIP